MDKIALQLVSVFRPAVDTLVLLLLLHFLLRTQAMRPLTAPAAPPTTTRSVETGHAEAVAVCMGTAEKPQRIAVRDASLGHAFKLPR